MLVGHLLRRTQILVGLSVMAFGTISFVVAPNYPSLFVTRIVAGLGAALISPVLSALGSTLVPPSQQGRALAIVVMGVSIATVVGVPASAWIAGHIGPPLALCTDRGPDDRDGRLDRLRHSGSFKRRACEPTPIHKAHQAIVHS
jgi:MFS family permease